MTLGPAYGNLIESDILQRVDDNAWELAQTDVKYFSPHQENVLAGTIFRKYFNTSLASDVTAGNAISALVDYRLYYKDATDRHISRGIYTTDTTRLWIALTGVSGNGNLALEVNGVTLLSGWVDYME